MATSSKAKELLESLVDHLQAQADLLPSLHAQLGLPPSALAADLERLRAVLAETVEAQIQQRHSEVTEWIVRCEKVERDCSVLLKCLGGSFKSSTSAIELRKNTVLPKRHEQLLAHQDSLHRTYTTKLEQRNTLTNRLASLSRTLGPGFYHPDILMPIPIANTSVDDVPRRDVTPEKLAKLDKEIDRGRIEINRRLGVLSGSLEAIVWLYSELGLELPAMEAIEDLSMLIADEQQSASEDSSFVHHSSSSASTSSASKPLPSTTSYDGILARYVSRLTEGDDEAFETLGVEGVDPTLDVMEYFDSLKVELNDLKTQRELSIQAMYDELETLWKRLGVPDAEIDAFVELNRGTTEEAVAAYEEEILRMHERRRQSMSNFIISAREEIASLWEELMMGPDDCSLFTAMYNDDHTEDLLTRHEDEILRLKEERRSKGPLLHSVRRYFDILKDEQELLESANDSSRLTGRGVGARRDPGRLLREEKARKRVKKDKPRLEQELLTTIPEWEETHDSHFRVHDQRIIDTLQANAEAEAAAKDVKQRPRPGAPSRSTTPAPSQGQNGHSSAQKHSAPSSVQGPPAKRARLAPSMSGSASQQPQYQRGTTPTFPSQHGAPRNTTPSAHETGRAPLRVSAFSNGAQGRPITTSTSSKTVYETSSHAPTTQPRSVSASVNGRYGFGAGIGLGAAPSSARIPSGSLAYGAGRLVSNSSIRTVSSSGVGAERGQAVAAIVARKSRRESFKPRPSVDLFAEPPRIWDGGEGVLKEESEDDEVF